MRGISVLTLLLAGVSSEGASRRVLFWTGAPALGLWFLGCSNDREEAVKQTLAFAQEAPYTIATPSERSSGFLLSVKDSALPSYNLIFRYFEPKDTTRATVYGVLPGRLFFILPIARLEQFSSQRLNADTVHFVVVFSRPERKLFEKTLLEMIPGNETVSATPNQQQEFQRFITRARGVLQEKDTAFFWVVSGPRIVRFATASQIRDSVAQKAIADADRLLLARVVRDASFSRLALTRWPISQEYSLHGGGSITGMVDPGPEGWPKVSGYANVHVTCEAKNGEEAVSVIGYVILEKLSPHDKWKFLCLWTSDDAEKWNDIKPKSFQVRLTAVAGRDSVMGEWTPVTER